MTGVQTCALPICFPVTITYGGAWEDKFAELIVRECADAIDSARPYHTNDHLVNDYMNGVEHGHKFAITTIRKHFGVER